MSQSDSTKEKFQKIFSYLPGSPVAILLYIVLTGGCVFGLVYSIFRLNLWLVEVDILTKLGLSSERTAAIFWMLIEAFATPVLIFILIVILSAVGVTVEDIQKILKKRYEEVDEGLEMETTNPETV
ncbi:hypothetical protein pv_269 [Pithovirus sibericum]|uniref:Transmembrane protein n=1 Tax=Pithovirus sibericum TaxID=1450746 RepID=W5S537_9VIRU|nr:hypothetical protein pv_269 [Pithovirus sibericum]AHH01836.1 hypothetical protein pv_269 [Pithovirus sibericum]